MPGAEHMIMTLPEWDDRRVGGGSIWTDVPRRRDERPPPARWQKILTAILHGVGAAGLLAAGTIWTINQQKPKYVQPGALLRLPVAVIEADKPDVETFRVSRVIARYTKGDTARAERIATAVVREGRRKNIDPALLIGLLIAENAKFDTTARSNVSARGLMQVMPFHHGKWGCGQGSLFDIDTNVCTGVAILADYMKRSPNLSKALLRYNGCVRGTNTPNCHTYSGKVLRYAEKAAMQMLSVQVTPTD